MFPFYYFYIENGLITNNRHILLDPVLLSFTAATTLTWINFHNQQHRYVIACLERGGGGGGGGGISHI